jgi:hypothetical protein
MFGGFNEHFNVHLFSDKFLSFYLFPTFPTVPFWLLEHFNRIQKKPPNILFDMSSIGKWIVVGVNDKFGCHEVVTELISHSPL